MTDELQTEKQEMQVDEGVERTRATRVYVPQVDIYTAGEDIIMLADMPGVNERDIEIALEKNVLTINGYISGEAPTGYELSHHEYNAGDYQRSFTLSDEIDQENIEASLKHGVLRVLLPKAPEVKAKKISVKVG